MGRSRVCGQGGPSSTYRWQVIPARQERAELRKVNRMSSLPGLESRRRTPGRRGAGRTSGERLSALLLAVAEKSRGQVAPVLDPGAPDAQAGADDDLGARRPQRLDVLRRDRLALRLAPSLLRRLVVGAAADIAVGHRLEALDHVAVVLETAGEHVGEEGAGIAGKRHGCIHRAVSVVPIVGNGGDAPSPGHPPAAPLTAPLLPLGGARRVGRNHGRGPS